MAKYKVKTIQILLKNNTTADYGELIDENLLSSDAEELVKKGYISKATKSDLDLEKNEAKAEADAKAKAEADAEAKAKADKS